MQKSAYVGKGAQKTAEVEAVFDANLTRDGVIARDGAQKDFAGLSCWRFQQASKKAA